MTAETKATIFLAILCWIGGTFMGAGIALEVEEPEPAPSSIVGTIALSAAPGASSSGYRKIQHPGIVAAVCHCPAMEAASND